MYIQDLTLSKFRCFEHASLSFRTPTGEALDPAILPNVTLVIGGNGAGKTTILKGIALALLSPMLQDSGFRPRFLVRRSRKSQDDATATIRGRAVFHWQDFGERTPDDLARPADVGVELVRIADTERLDWGMAHGLLQGVTLREVARAAAEPVRRRQRADGLGSISLEDLAGRMQRAMFSNTSPACFLVGYGATRRVESSERFDPSAREKSRSPRYQRVAGLFEDHVALTPLAAWLPRLNNPGREKQVKQLLTAMLPERCRFTGERQGSDYLFDLDGSRMPFDALSDGFRAYIGWVADMLYHVCLGCPTGVKLDAYRGVILVDEIDLHLHPAWQRVVVTQLSRALPLMQFVLTSHSPIVAGSAEPTNVRLLRQAGKEGAMAIEESGAPLFGLNATQILESPYFGLPSTRAPIAVQSLKRLARRAQGGDSAAGLDFLKALAGDRRRLTGVLRPEPPPPTRRRTPATKRTKKKGRGS